MTTPAQQSPARLSYRSLFVSLSRARVSAYSIDADSDSTDAVARYLWNIALAAAFQPVVHMVEVAFRNAIFDVGAQTTSARHLRYRTVDCWLDANPSLLERKEEDDVVEATRRLGPSPKRHSPGHLVGQLGLGFWVRLCNRPYEHGRSAGPHLWPAAVKRFPNCPRPQRNRADISRAFGELRDFRNLVAHHQPIWDRHPLRWHERALELIEWMNPHLSATVRSGSQLVSIYDAGPAAYRSWAAQTMTF